jgi:hypothetical protein
MLQITPGLISSAVHELCNSLATYVINIFLFKKYDAGLITFVCVFHWFQYGVGHSSEIWFCMDTLEIETNTSTHCTVDVQIFSSFHTHDNKFFLPRANVCGHISSWVIMGLWFSYPSPSYIRSLANASVKYWYENF